MFYIVYSYNERNLFMYTRRILVVLICMLMLCSCGEDIKYYKIYDESIVSFTEALSVRKLIGENITKADDGQTITEAEYSYKSDNPADDKVNYLYYLLNNYGATFLSDDTVAIDSGDLSFAVIVKITETEQGFTINLSKKDL